MAERAIHVDPAATAELRKRLRQTTPDADAGQVKRSTWRVRRAGFCPEGVGALGGYYGCDGLRSGPETGDV
ncbi:hypothetical protein JN853_23305 [Pseudomonas syringae pv. actinidiae ICMP 9853]|nr:hypothetical protein JN853_23305 [Pseudomonas syringae pv. actinidiae ICMP 9853]AQX60652.1 hypothetical protein B1R35_23135 [Pseudomonas syringae pv. actinidiae]AQX64820.1 hypothetical protein B1F85_12770 [Pseudomonas syringae pv. actinidiae]